MDLIELFSRMTKDDEGGQFIFARERFFTGERFLLVNAF
jgi:hypothetical protein